MTASTRYQASRVAFSDGWALYDSHTGKSIDVEDEGAAHAAARSLNGWDGVERRTGAEVHHTVESFAAATGFSVEMVEAHGITVYNSATGVPLHRLIREDA